MADKIKYIDKWYGGVVRDDKSNVTGAASNMEEIDIFSNKDFFQAEQIFSADTLPASTEVYAYTADNSDQAWAYGKSTASNEVRLLKVTSAGDDNPGAWATVFTSADTTDIAYTASPIQYFRRDDGNQDFLYYLTNASGTVKMKSYDITAGTESEQDSAATNMTLTGLDGSFDRCAMRVGFGELYVMNGQYIAKIDKDGVFTEKAFTLPNGWEAVDIVFVSDLSIILARNINRKINQSKGFWWDLTATQQVDDSFDISMGGPQWITNFKEKITFLCAINGVGRLFTLSGAFPGAVPISVKGVKIDNVADETTTQTISAPKMLDTDDNVLYFALNKTDKTGMYAMGQLDDDKPFAFLLSKRFHTSDYSLHTPHGILIQGPNYFGAFDDNGTNSAARCESNNSPARSSNAVYESIQIDDGDALTNKDVGESYVATQPLAASTDVDLSISTDYGSYTEVFRADGTSFNTTNGVLARYESGVAKVKVFKLKVALTSSGTDSPKVTALGARIQTTDLPSAF